MSFINHPKVYERLDWSVKNNTPIVINTIPIKSHEDEEEESSDSSSDDSSLSFNYDAKFSLGELRKMCDNVIPEDVIFNYHRFLIWNEKIQRTQGHVNLKFISLTVPPNTKLVVHNKKKEFGNTKQSQMISYLRNKIREFIRLCDIKDYIIVFEQTRTGLIHSHICYIPPEDFIETYKDLADVMEYNTYKKMTLNIVEENVTDIDQLLCYLCKIKYLA